MDTTEDAVLEGNETFTVGLTDTGTGTIDNDDSAAVTVNDADADEGDDGRSTTPMPTKAMGSPSR